MLIVRCLLETCAYLILISLSGRLEVRPDLVTECCGEPCSLFCGSVNSGKDAVVGTTLYLLYWHSTNTKARCHCCFATLTDIPNDDLLV